MQRVNQLAGGWERLYLPQKAGLEDFAVRIAQGLLLGLCNSRKQRRNQQIGALADLLTKQMARNAAAEFSKGFVPSHDMEFIAVDKRAVYVEKDSLAGAKDLAGLFCFRAIHRAGGWCLNHGLACTARPSRH